MTTDRMTEERQEQIASQRHEEMLAVATWSVAYEHAVQSQNQISKFVSGIAALGLTATSGMLATGHLLLLNSLPAFFLCGLGYFLSLGPHESLTSQQVGHANNIAKGFNKSIKLTLRLPIIEKKPKYYAYGAVSILLSVLGVIALGWGASQNEATSTTQVSQFNDMKNHCSTQSPSYTVKDVCLAEQDTV